MTRKCPHCGRVIKRPGMLVCDQRANQLWAAWCQAIGWPVTRWPVKLDTAPPAPAPAPAQRRRRRRRTR